MELIKTGCKSYILYSACVSITLEFGFVRTPLKCFHHT